MSQMSFARAVKNINMLAKGAPAVFLPEGAHISGVGEALTEQMDDLIAVLSEMGPTYLAELEQSLAESASGCCTAINAFRTLKEHGRRLSESANYEAPKIGQTVSRIDTALQGIGSAHAALLSAVRQARQTG